MASWYLVPYSSMPSMCSWPWEEFGSTAKGTSVTGRGVRGQELASVMMSSGTGGIFFHEPRPVEASSDLSKVLGPARWLFFFFTWA